LNRKIVLIKVLFFLFCHVFYAQVEKEKQPLIEVIQQLEEQFKCNFSYADKTIENILVALPIKPSSLQEIVKYLEEQTLLKFTLLDANLITIGVKSESFNICGFLIDYDTEEVVQNVTIHSGNKSTLSDEQGYFELFNLSKNELVSIRHMTYKSVNYLASQFSDQKCNNHYLIPKIEQISEIVIRNYLTKGIRKTITGSFDIDYKNFGILPGLIEPDVLQTLQSLPGVQSVDESVSNINIRGGAHHENLILWDGIKMYQSGHFFGLISAFNPQLTKKVILTKNGTHANLTDGVSGTILMFTDDELTHKMKTSIGLNLINADAFLDIPLGKNSSVQISSRKSISDWIKTPSYKQYFEKAFQNTEVVNNSENVINSDDEFSFYDINMRWLYQITPNDKLRVNLLDFSNELFFLENAFVRGQEESRESSASQDNLAAGIYYNRIWSDRLSMELQLYATKYLLKSTNFDILNQQRLIQKNEVLEESVKFDSKYLLTDNLILNNGYQYVETGVSNIQDVDNPLFKSTVKEVIREHGLSSQLGYQSDQRITNINIGVRLNYLEKFGTFFLEPRMSLSQRFLDDFTVEVLAEMKHQNTTQVIDFQNDFLGIENRRWLLSNNADIPIIKSKQVDIGLHYNKKGWLVSAESYYKKVNGITTQSQGFQNQYQFTKTDGSYAVIGADFLINKQFKNLSSWLSYSYVENIYTFKTLPEITFPNNIDIRHAVSLASTYTLKNFKISSGLNWHIGKPTTKPVAGNEIVDDEINYQASNSSRIIDYMRVDVSAQYSFNISKKVKAQAGISVWNLLHQKNETNAYYQLVNNEKVDKIVQSSLGLTPNASFRVSF